MDAILTFHSIDDSGSVLSFPARDLDQLMGTLQRENAHVVTLGEMLANDSAPGRNRVALTFDDGMLSVAGSALPILRRHGARATVFVVSGRVGRDNRWPSQPASAPTFPLMSWENLAALVQAGWEIGAHGVEHAPLTHLDTAAAERELGACRERIQKELNIRVDSFAYPYGAWNPQADRHVQRFYAAAVTTHLAYRSGQAVFRLPRLDTYYLRGVWARRPLFGPLTRTYLGLRGGLRRLRRGGAD
jgi:peptidoglycan/xylan/chitin deacetylase (PgdA/CDA1 family)